MGWQSWVKFAGEAALVGNWRCARGNVQGMQRDKGLQCSSPDWKVYWAVVRSDKNRNWDHGPNRSAWDQGPPTNTQETQKPNAQETGNREKVTVQKDPAALMMLLLGALEKSDTRTPSRP